MLVGILKKNTKRLVKKYICITFSLLFSTSAVRSEDIILVAEKVLSKTGSNRATAYSDTNTLLEHNNRIFFSWQEASNKKFNVRLASYSQISNDFSQSINLGASYDNHGGASIAIDLDGYLHVAYYPHSHPVKYKKSTTPLLSIQNLEFSEVELVGSHITYPKLIFDNKNNLYLFGRKSKNQIGPDPVYKYGFHMKVDKSPVWGYFKTILASEYSGYAHFATSILVDANNVLHFHFRIHENSTREVYGKSQRIAYLKKDGKRWKNLAGKEVEESIRFDMSGFFDSIDFSRLDILENGGEGEDFSVLNIGKSTVNKDGIVLLLHTTENSNSATLKLTKIMPNSPIKKQVENILLPIELNGWSYCSPTGGVDYNKNGSVVIVTTICKKTEYYQKTSIHKSGWGSQYSKVVGFIRYKDNDSFSYFEISDENSKTNWHPKIIASKKNSQFYIMYTEGKGLTQNIVRFKVFEVNYE